MFWSVDRIENGQAVCISDAEQQCVLPLSSLPPETKEGSVLWEEKGVYRIDREEETRRRERIAALLAGVTRKEEKE